MKNKFDEKIANMLSKDIYIPQKITNRIKTSLKEERKGVSFTMKLNKIVAAVAGVVIIGTGAVFAGKAIIEMRNSVNIAKDYGYFENIDTNYIYHNGLGIKIENYFIDQGRVGVTFRLQCDDNSSLLELYNTQITKNNTYSETIDGIVYVREDQSENGKAFSERYRIIQFIDENGNEVRFDEDSIGGRGPALEQYEHLDNNTVKFLYTTPVYQEVTAKKMKVVIKRVIVHKEGKEKEYLGDWEFEIDLADKYFNNAKSIQYHATVNLDNVTVEKAELSATRLLVTIKADNIYKLLYGSEDSKEMVYGAPELFGEEGKYDFDDLNTSQANYYEENKIVMNFDISKFSSENSYKIVIPAMDRSGNNLVITLNK